MITPIQKEELANSIIACAMDLAQVNNVLATLNHSAITLQDVIEQERDNIVNKVIDQLVFLVSERYDRYAITTDGSIHHSSSLSRMGMRSLAKSYITFELIGINGDVDEANHHTERFYVTAGVCPTEMVYGHTDAEDANQIMVELKKFITCMIEQSQFYWRSKPDALKQQAQDNRDSYNLGA